MSISRLLISQLAEAATGKCPLISPSNVLKKKQKIFENVSGVDILVLEE